MNNIKHGTPNYPSRKIELHPMKTLTRPLKVPRILNTTDLCLHRNRDTMHPFRSKGCKVTDCQSWRSQKKSVALAITADRVQLCVARAGIILKVSLMVTLQPFDLQRFIVPLWKDLNSLENILALKKVAAYFKDKFCYLLLFI